MTVPSIVSMIDSNIQLIGIQALGLNPSDLATYTANLQAAYRATIATYIPAGSVNPYLADALQAELVQLSTLTPAQLATLPVRGP